MSKIEKVLIGIVGTLFAVLIIMGLFTGFYPSIGGNKTLIDTKWEYNKAYITIGNDTKMVDIEKWSEDGTTFTLICKDGTIYCTDQINVVLVK